MPVNRLSNEAISVLGNEPQVDIVILVPKDDEFQAHLDVFGIPIQPADLPTLKNSTLPFAHVDLADLSVVLVCMQNQGNTQAADTTRELLHLLNPAHIYLSGTSLGNPKRSFLGSIRVSDHIDHATQWVQDDAGRMPRWNHYDPPASLRRDFGTFMKKDADGRAIRAAVVPFLTGEFPEKWEYLLREVRIAPELTHMVTDNDLLRHEGVHLWEFEERAASYDMECGGFGNVLNGETGIAWAVVRSVSDFGRDKPAAETGMRRVAGLLCALFLKSFLTSGLSKSHPKVFRSQQLSTPRLSPDQHYSRHSAIDYFSRRLKDEFGFELTMPLLGRDLVLDDLALHLQMEGMPHDDAIRFLRVLRIEYFEEKYLNYTYEVDIRGYWSEYWYQEYREFMASYSRETLSRSDVLVVGSGNGLELPFLFTNGIPKTLQCVDLSKKMLDRSFELYPHISRLHATDAATLNDIPDESIDVYISLRTYMSRFFDKRKAIREAYRVLRPNGLIVLSIANGYRDFVGGSEVIVPGLKDVNGSEFVDPDRPFALLFEYQRLLRALGFQQIFTYNRLTDVYIGGVKPGYGSPLSLRLSPESQPSVDRPESTE